MFQRPFRVKSQTAIKGSDRKKLRAEISKQFSDFPPDDLANIIPNKEEMSVMKVYTHSGENVIVYILQKCPIFFELHKVLYPTVYILWKYPDLLPLFTTWPPVLSKIVGGADLMLPGVVIKGDVTPASLGNLEKGTMCAVNLVGNRSPVAVGYTAMSSSDMYDSNMRGKGVIITHAYTDHLWEAGDKSHPPLNEDTSVDSETANTVEGNDVDTDTIQSGKENVESCLIDLTLDNNASADMSHESSPCDTPVGDKGDDTAGASGDNIDVINKDNPGAEDEEDNDGGCDNDTEEESMSAEDMDVLLTNCFLCAIKCNVKKSDLPLLTSKFYRSHLLPCCPRGQYVDIKKSTYKKLSKFLTAMQKDGLITLKELSKGVESITEIHKDCSRLRGFSVPEGYLPPVEESSAADSVDEFQPPQIKELYSVTAAVMPLFQAAGYKKGDPLTASDVRKALTDYVKETKLQNEASKGYVVLDPFLSDCLTNKDERHYTHLKWEEVFSRCFAKMQSVCQITFPGQQPIIKKGKVEPVKLTTAQRAGNKKVTLVENLETFGIAPQKIAHHIQRGVACSTSVNPLPGKNKGMQVLVQGNQINYIGQLLQDKYQLPAKFISGLDKAPKSGKKKR